VLACNVNLRYEDLHDLDAVMGRHLGQIGPSILLTSLTNFICFLCGMMSSLPLVIDFSAQAAIGISFIFFAVLFMFVAMLSLELRVRAYVFGGPKLAAVAPKPVEAPAPAPSFWLEETKSEETKELELEATKEFEQEAPPKPIILEAAPVGKPLALEAPEGGRGGHGSHGAGPGERFVDAYVGVLKTREGRGLFTLAYAALVVSAACGMTLLEIGEKRGAASVLGARRGGPIASFVGPRACSRTTRARSSTSAATGSIPVMTTPDW